MVFYRQDEQDFENKIQKITNNLNTNNSNAPSQFDIDQMQKKFDEAKKNYDDTSVQIKQIQDIISQQNQMIIEQKKLKDDENKKYDVYLKLVKVDNSVKTQVKKVQRPTILDEQNSNQMPDILNDSPAPTVIIKSEVSVEKPLYKRTFDRIRSFLVWW